MTQFKLTEIGRLNNILYMKNYKILFPLFFSLSCSGFFYWPEKVQYLPYSKITKNYKELTITTSDNVKLHAVYFSSTLKKPKSLIVQFHGNAENLSTHMLSLGWVVEEGHDLLVFDYRGYGKSEGKTNQKGTYQDAMAILKVANELKMKKEISKLIIYGQSLGGVIATNAVGDSQEGVDLLVVESSFGSYTEIAFNALKQSWITFLFSPLAYLLVSNQYGSYEKLPTLKNMPMLIIHGDKDDVVPYKFGEKLYGLKEGPKWFWSIKDGRHIAAFHTDGVTHRNRFLKFIDELPNEIKKFDEPTNAKRH